MKAVGEVYAIGPAGEAGDWTSPGRDLKLIREYWTGRMLHRSKLSAWMGTSATRCWESWG